MLVNQLTSLVCEAEGAPSPIIMWYKDDIQVNGDIPSLCLWSKSFKRDFLISSNVNILLHILIVRFY